MALESEIQKAANLVSGIEGVISQGLGIFTKVKETFAPTPTTPAPSMTTSPATISRPLEGPPNPYETTTALPLFGPDNKSILILLAIVAGLYFISKQ